MGRVINTDGPGKKRNQLMRTSAELLRRLSQKQDIDDDTRNMLALLYYCLKEIEAGIDDSARAWEKRDYWMKSEEFRQRWRWAGEMGDELGELIHNEQWQDLPGMMAKLFPKFSDITVNKLTRKASLWEGCYDRFLEEHDDKA